MEDKSYLESQRDSIILSKSKFERMSKLFITFALILTISGVVFLTLGIVGFTTTVNTLVESESESVTEALIIPLCGIGIGFGLLGVIIGAGMFIPFGIFKGRANARSEQLRLIEEKIERQ